MEKKYSSKFYNIGTFIICIAGILVAIGFGAGMSREDTTFGISLALFSPFSRAHAGEKKEFLELYGEDYGYNGKLEVLRNKEFPHLKGHTYLDFTGSGLYQKRQIDQFHDDLLTTLYGNAHSPSPCSYNTQCVVDMVREELLKYFHADSDEYSVVFTSGCTGALKLIADSFPWGEDNLFYYLHQNHNSVLGMRELCRREGCNSHSVFPDEVSEVFSNSVDSIKNVGKYDMGIDECTKNSTENKFNLFAFPAEDNFDGSFYPLDWIELIHQHENRFSGRKDWKVVLDAAAFVPTNPLRLDIYKPDFVTLSFYKMFGYPSGLGALILRNDFSELMKKQYWGGGTVQVALSERDFKLFYLRPCQRFEDGTISFLDIASTKYGLEAMNYLGIENINSHVKTVTAYLYQRLDSLYHSNGQKFVEFYGRRSPEHLTDLAGSIISLNFFDENGSYIPHFNIGEYTASRNIHIRYGCMCNPGSCHSALQIEPDQVIEASDILTCGDSVDIDGKPYGAVRLSLGYVTTVEDIFRFMDTIQDFLS